MHMDETDLSKKTEKEAVKRLQRKVCEVVVSGREVVGAERELKERMQLHTHS